MQNRFYMDVTKILNGRQEDRHVKINTNKFINNLFETNKSVKVTIKPEYKNEFDEINNKLLADRVKQERIRQSECLRKHLEETEQKQNIFIESNKSEFTNTFEDLERQYISVEHKLISEPNYDRKRNMFMSTFGEVINTSASIQENFQSFDLLDALVYDLSRDLESDKRVLQQDEQNIKKQLCDTLMTIKEAKQLQQQEFTMAIKNLAKTTDADLVIDYGTVRNPMDIDIYNSATAISYGSSIMHDLSAFSDEMLSHVTVQESGEMGEYLTSLVMDLKSSDVDGLTKQPSLLSKIPIVGYIFNTPQKLMIRFSDLSTQVDKVSTMLGDTLRSLYIDMEMLEQLKIKNHQHYQELTRLIKLGEERLHIAKNEELPAMQLRANESGDMMELQKVKERAEQINRFERRLTDLKIAQLMAVQTSPQIQLMQNNDISLAEKLQSSVTMIIPLWKNQMMLGLSMQKQQKSAALQRTVSDATNTLLQQNSAMLKDASLTIAREVERPIVDMPTLEQAHATLIKTIEETLKISEEGKQKRQLTMEKITQLDDSLRQNLQAIIDNSNVKALTVSTTNKKAITETTTGKKRAGYNPAREKSDGAYVPGVTNPPPPKKSRAPKTTNVSL